MRILIIALLGYFVYKAYFKKTGDGVANDDTLTHPLINSTLQTQPQQKYYQKPPLDPRVDGADQPWVIGSRNFLGQVGSDILSSGDERDSSIMNYNTKEFWTDLGSRYSH